MFIVIAHTETGQGVNDVLVYTEDVLNKARLAYRLKQTMRCQEYNFTPGTEIVLYNLVFRKFRLERPNPGCLYILRKTAEGWEEEWFEGEQGTSKTAPFDQSEGFLHLPVD